MDEILDEAAVSADGSSITWQRLGRGPCVIVLHGAVRAGRHYRAMAAALARRFTMLLVDRRGRGRSGPLGPSHTMTRELDDVAAVMAATGATQVFGHSAGALIALEAARVLPIRRLALYDPTVAIEAQLPLDWVPAFEAAIAADRPARALAISTHGLQMLPWRMPAWMWWPLFALAMRSDGGRQMAALVRTLPSDLALGRALGDDVERYRQVTCPTLLLGGARSPGYLHRALDRLHPVLPDARRVDLPGVGHNAPDEQAPETVAAELARFFDADETGASNPAIHPGSAEADASSEGLPHAAGRQVPRDATGLRLK
jgi:pimeloyl-ACP methyl ester carboxylesterase